MALIQPVFIDQEIQNNGIPYVDDWIPTEEDNIFKTTKGYIYMNISSFYNTIFNGNGEDPLNYFTLKNKRSYNSDEFRHHCIHYLNYFERYFDRDHELQMIYIKMKYLIDYEESYSKDMFINDLKRYILYGDIFVKSQCMNKYNYQLDLSYKNKKNPVLQYSDRHAIILMHISLLVNIMIPLLMHFMFIKNITNTTEFLLEIYDIIFGLFDVDIFSKLYETSLSNVNMNSKSHSVLWEAQDIRGKNITTHSLNCVNNILINICPKYLYNNNIIKLNYSSILNNTGFQITDISYEFSFVSLSSSKRDIDNNSELDKYEALLSKVDEALLIQNKVSCEEAMKVIEMKFGPFSDDEINFYIRELSDNGRFSINSFQKELIFNLFYKFFGDPISIKSINMIDYIKLMISAKRILEFSGMSVLAYIISSKVQRLVTRKNINKKELIKLEASPFYSIVKDKYKSDKIEKQILSIIAILLSSEFTYVSYEYEEIHGKRIDVIPELICEEVLMYISVI